MPVRFDVLTFGHSNHQFDRFAEILIAAGSVMVLDVRTTPFSRYQPQFTAKNLSASLQAKRLGYVWLGKELGGRPAEDRLYAADGSADYVAMAREPSFLGGLDQVLKHARSGPVCLVCSERDPLECHRCLLVGRALAEKGLSLGHIHVDGRTESQPALEERLIRIAGAKEADLFDVGGDRLARAYVDHAKKIAFRKRDSMSRIKGMRSSHDTEQERGNGYLGPPEPAPGR